MNDKYTCSDYRQEMILLGLRERLKDENITVEEQQKLQAEVASLEEAMGVK